MELHNISVIKVAFLMHPQLPVFHVPLELIALKMQIVIVQYVDQDHIQVKERQVVQVAVLVLTIHFRTSQDV